MSESPITIRPHRPSDEEAVAALIVPIQRDEFEIAITRADQPDLADVDGFYRKGVGEFWVATPADANADEHVVGSIALIDIGADMGGNRIGVIRKMFVASPFRGPELKVAQRLLRHLIEHARAHGLARLVLGTTDKFLAAHRFYEREGFRVIPAETLPEAFPRMAVDTRFYELDL